MLPFQLLWQQIKPRTLRKINTIGIGRTTQQMFLKKMLLFKFYLCKSIEDLSYHNNQRTKSTTIKTTLFVEDDISAKCQLIFLHIASEALMFEYFIGNIWTASSEFGTYRLSEQRRFRRACAFAQSRQNLRCSLIQAVSQEEPSDRKPYPWPL